MLDGVPDGYWQGFCSDATRMRSGYFRKGAQVGKWVTYDTHGRVHKVTSFENKQTTKKTAHKQEAPRKRD